MVGRVSTFSQTLYVLNRSLESQARLADVQAQTASGLKSDTFGGYGTSTSAIARQENQIAAADAEAASATSALNVVEQAYSALGSISDLTETILSSLATYGEDSTTLASLASGWLDDLQSLLNSTYGDQALFAGDALDADAVDLDAWDATDADAYYNGGGSARAYTTSDGQVLALSVTATDPALSGLIDALKGLAAGTTSSGDALDAVQTASSGIGVLRASLSSNASRLERISEQATARSDTLTSVVSTLKEADLAEASVLATQYETLLQTSYSTLNILISIKLSDYLR
ncbi:flagellin [Brevundimonas sp. SL130]|uniref:flagellin n=1 Tax=Brevundimonas sp. SL130 TaxID=2995143 RepID=UPI00226D3DA7|nr:flagellin [Brevundimonas sp. SL130]WAC60698.1 flagellin [Brevundimonas sp. SL130]